MREILSFMMMLAASQAFAHSSAAPHEHPHASSVYAGLDTFAALIIVVGLGYSVWLWMRSGRP